jgi:hypothetical protein
MDHRGAWRGSRMTARRRPREVVNREPDDDRHHDQESDQRRDHGSVAEGVILGGTVRTSHIGVIPRRPGPRNIASGRLVWP